MQLSNSPGKLVLPFAASGNKNSIPVASQIGITPGAASLADGFPPLTMTPVAAGGVPPSGLDMNGILYEMSAIVRWANAGGGYAYDADFAASDAVGGYPKGSRVLRADGFGYWFNTVDNNETDPDSESAAGWVPDFATGVAVVPMTSANVTLTPFQYGKPIIVITGLLTANLNLIFPNIDQGWTIINLTTGGFSLTAKTADEIGCFIYPNFVGRVICYDGDMLVENSNVKYKFAAEFGITGNGSDETSKIQNALDLSEGSVLLFDPNKTYGYTILAVRQNTTIITNGAIFNRLAASTTSGVSIAQGVNIDSLIITTPGGSSGDKGVVIRGSNVTLGRLSVTATAQGVYNSTNYALEIESSPAGTKLTGINIDNFYCKYLSTAIFAKNVQGLTLNRAVVEYYRTAFYLKDVSDSEFTNVTCRYLGNAVDGRPGENGLLIESSLASDSSKGLVFNQWRVEDSGEHAYRLGGQLSIADVWFNDCISERSGSSILSGNLTSGEWHGGCGFKVLGGNSTVTEFHRNIHFTNCGVIDCNITEGAYPAGHGVANFQPWLIVMAENVHLNGCWTAKKNQAYVARYGIEAAATDGLYLNGCSFVDVGLVPLRPYEETPIVGYPGSDLPLVNLQVTGGVFETNTTTPGDGAGLYFSENAAYNHKNWTISGATFRGGALAFRFEEAGAGSFENINFDFTYLDSNVNDSTYTIPVVAGSIYSLVSAKAPWRPLAFTPSVLNGSNWQDTLGGQFYSRSNNAWKLGSATSKLVIADDSFATVVPPADLNPGFLLISGSGTTKHMMAWYRATSSPSSSKYAGAAATAIVNTALNGTTGTDGNITVGVQNDLIYIENRGGSSDTFIITFL